MIRWLQFKSLYLRRLHPLSRETILSRLLHSNMVLWNQQTASRGVAIGMFWAFTPMPFQMVPATLFCWLIRGNLPVAILCVWITNPLTLPPILLLEYRIGEIILQTFLELQATELIISGNNIYSIFAGGLRNILVGGLFISCLMMTCGYVTIFTAFNLSARHRRKPRHTVMSNDVPSTNATPPKGRKRRG